MLDHSDLVAFCFTTVIRITYLSIFLCYAFDRITSKVYFKYVSVIKGENDEPN